MATTTASVSDTRQARLFLQALHGYTRALASRSQELETAQARLDARTARIADRLVSVNRAYHYRDLALAGHSDTAAAYFTRLMESHGVL